MPVRGQVATAGPGGDLKEGDVWGLSVGVVHYAGGVAGEGVAV